MQRDAHTERADGAVLRAMNVSFVDACSLLRAELPDTGDACGVSDGGSQSTTIRSHGSPALASLASRMFPYSKRSGLGDPIHPTESYGELMGCAAARLLTAPTAARATRRHGNTSSQLPGKHLTAPSGGSSVEADAGEADAPAEPQCLEAGTRELKRVIANATGWAVRSGGAGGTKTWLHANVLGASLTLRLPIGAKSSGVAIEYYKHDTLPLGVVNASLAWPTTIGEPLRMYDQLLDGQCVAADACPKGQGFYYHMFLAERLKSAGAMGATAQLRLELVPRPDGMNGTDFSFVAAIVT